jgi:hypothetical protein
LKAIAWFALGGTITGSLLLPTYLKYGFRQGAGGTNWAVAPNVHNLSSIVGILKRSISFAVFDVSSFIGGHTADRIAFFKAQPWLLPIVLFLSVVGIMQAFALIAFWFRKDPEQSGWRAIKYLVVFNVCLIYVSFLFSIKPPQSNHLYISFPLLMIYSLYCWNQVLQGKRWQRLAKVFLVCGIIFHIGLALYNLPRTSLYPVRARVQSAIENKDYRIVGERRPNTLY